MSIKHKNSGYDRFTLFVTYRYQFAKKIGKNTQLHRSDITRLKFENDGVPVHELHPIAILYKKLLSVRHCIQTAIIYDNAADNYRKETIIYKGTKDAGSDVLDVTRDWRHEYYDLESGKPYPPAPGIPKQQIASVTP